MSEENANLQELKEIINFAAQREQESMDFYSDLAKKVKSPEVIEEIQKIIEIEKGHRDSLKNIDVTAFLENLAEKRLDFKITNYLDEIKPSPNMSIQDLLTIAMHREKKAEELYTDLAKLFVNDSRRLFEQLAKEEGGHQHFFEFKWGKEVLQKSENVEILVSYEK